MSQLQVEADAAFELAVAVAEGQVRDVAEIAERLADWRSGTESDRER